MTNNKTESLQAPYAYEKIIEVFPLNHESEYKNRDVRRRSARRTMLSSFSLKKKMSSRLMKLQLIATSAILALSLTGGLHAAAKQVHMKDATLADYEEVKNGKYSKKYIIDSLGPVYLFSKSEDGLGEVTIVVRTKDGPYLSHGLSDKFRKEDVTEGIPIDADPEMLVVYPSEKTGGEPFVKRYIFKERC